ncbi:MAG: SDR family NAD(P)-dependent oxidoreductase [Candidatus Zixiibacteriota bacterium]
MINLKDKVALITGASRGIGRATALLFAKAGCDLVINYCNEERDALKVASQAEEFGVRAKVFRADVSKQEDVNEMVAYTVREFGRIDILVNNAGIWKYAAIDTMTEGQLKETLEVNLCSAFYSITASVPHMIKRGSGNIINVSSTAGQRGEPFHSHYAASKGAIISLTKSLAVELAPHNIRVNCVAPGWVDTDMSHESLIGGDKEEILSLIPLGRAGTAEEIAGSILFLASDFATFITGEIINVNGGAVLCG